MLRFYPIVLLFLIQLLYAGNALSQVTGDDFFFENLNITNGLPHNTVQSIFQDSDGYMWFATKDGLCRYDGNNYIVYRESLGTESLSNSKIRCISEDNNKNIWVGTDNNLNMIDPITRHVTSFLLSSYSQLKNNKINELYFDHSDNNLWIATESGMTIYNTAKREFVTPGEDVAFAQPTNTVGQLSKEEIYIGTNSGLFIYNKITGRTLRVNIKDRTQNYNVYSVFTDSAGDSWVGTNINLLGKLDKEKKEISVVNINNIKMSDDYGICSIVEQDSLLWLISKRKGIFFYNRIEKRFERMNESFSINVLGADASERIMLTSAFKDNSGTIWIGSYYMGVFYYSQYINQFDHIFIKRDHQLSTGIIGPILQDGEGLWFGSSDIGITYYNTKHKEQRYYEIYDSGVSLTECKPLLIDGNTLWIGTDSRGIFLFDIKQRSVIKHYHTSSVKGKLPGNRINYGLKDSEGRIWIGYNGNPGGLCRFYDKTETFVTYFPEDLNNKVKDIYFIHQASASELRVGTRNNGLFQYNIEENIFAPIPVMNREDLSVSFIFEDRHKQLWIGTFGQGLIRMDHTMKVQHLFNCANNNINDNICGILEDNNGRIWISSFNEISYYDAENNKFVRYDMNNNFPIQHIKPMSCLLSKDQLLYFGGSNGMVEANPEKLMNVNKIAPKVVLTDFFVHNQPVTTIIRKNILRDRIVKLKYDQQNLTFLFAALNYIYPEKNQYRYKLEGVDNEWNLSGTQNQVTYNNLTAGQYHFMVSACNNSEIWSEPENLLIIVIEPAPWRTWWAYLIYTTIIVSLLALFFYYQKVKINLEHNLNLKNVEKKNLEAMHSFRLNLFTNFSHEIRTPLTLISISLSDLLKEHTSRNSANKNTLERIEKNVNKISTLVDQLMDFRKHDEGRMELNASEHDLIPFIQDIAATFKELSELKNHPVKMNVPEKGFRLWYDPQLLEKVFYNVIMNAFKYSYNESEICLNAELVDLHDNVYRNKVDKLVDRAVLISIFNQGDNIPEDKLEKLFEPFYRLKNVRNVQGTGIGLSLNRMIMRLHHSDIWAENVQGEGIVFKFMIPVGKGHFGNELDEEIENGYELVSDRPVSVNPPILKELPRVNKDFRTLLLVEDNEEIRIYLKSKLLLSYNVFDCSNGREALDIINRKNIDLVISDVLMPVMDGIALCKAIKSDLGINHIPVILLTAQTTDAHIKDGLCSGANEYIPKPFKFDLLLVRIQNLIENNERLRQSFQKRINLKDMNVEVTDYDEQFLQKCYDHLCRNLTDPELSIESFGKEIGVSRVHLYRKLKYLTGLSPSQFIMNIRIKAAADLLSQEGVSVSDVCYQVGFNNLSYFTRCFKQSYGMSPSDYKQKR